MKKYISRFLILLALILPLTVMEARAEEVTGTCGDNLTWVLDDAGTLTISGSGAMTDYTSPSDVPWYADRTLIQAVVMEEGVTSIGNSAFSGCTSLTEVTIPDGVTSINYYAFCDCENLSSITLPDSIASIEACAFYDCTSLQSITLPDSLTAISRDAFHGCMSLRSITIPDGVTSIGDYAFFSCTSLTEVAIPDSVTEIGQYAFSHCSSLTNVTIPDGVTSIPWGTFGNCSSLTSVRIPNSVKKIEEHAFINCSSLTEVTIPASTYIINLKAFKGCSSLATVHYGGTTEKKAYMQIGSSNEYFTEANWHYECDGTACRSVFTDVFYGDYYFASVQWAVEQGITNGVTETTFSPEGICTRAQVVTFLWRANGSPAPVSGNNPFTDVPAGQWYTDAVLWAVENGITTGTSATTFAPDAGCSRGQVATFLWRAEGKPAPVSGNNPFPDVPAGQWYTDAVLWAVENEITNGVGDGRFAPDDTCTRGQIVTFLYRAMT